MTLLFDTDFLLAKYNNRDEKHEITNKMYSKIMQGDYGNPFLLDYVFDELMTLVQVRSSNKIASQVGKELLELVEKELITFLQINSSDFYNAWKLFSNQTNSDNASLGEIKKWQQSGKSKKFLSFTDCILIEVANSLQIPVIASFDQRFKSWVQIIPKI